MGIGLGFILGGALQGVGGGMMMQQKLADEERRDMALERLRGERRKDEIETTYKLAGQNQLEHDTRDIDASREEREDEQSYKLTLAGKSAEAEAEANQQQRDWDVDDRNFKAKQERREKALDRILKYEELLGEPIDEDVDEITGDKTLIFRDRKAKSGVRTVVLPQVARRQPRAKAGSGSSLFDDDAMGSGTQQPTRSRAAPAAPVEPEAPYIWDTEQKRTVRNPNWRG